MCDAIGIASLALSALSTGAGMIAQQQQARAQEEYNKQATQNAMLARDLNVAALDRERAEAAADTSEQMTRNQMALRRAQATARVSAGEAGVSGLSVDALLRDLALQAGYDNATAAENYQRVSRNIDARRENAQISMANTINSLPPVQTPNYLGGALQIGQAGLGAYTGYRDRQERRRLLITR